MGGVHGRMTTGIVDPFAAFANLCVFARTTTSILRNSIYGSRKDAKIRKARKRSNEAMSTF